MRFFIILPIVLMSFSGFSQSEEEAPRHLITIRKTALSTLYFRGLYRSPSTALNGQYSTSRLNDIYVQYAYRFSKRWHIGAQYGLMYDTYKYFLKSDQDPSKYNVVGTLHAITNMLGASLSCDVVQQKDLIVRANIFFHIYHFETNESNDALKALALFFTTINPIAMNADANEGTRLGPPVVTLDFIYPIKKNYEIGLSGYLNMRSYDTIMGLFITGSIKL